MQRKRYTCTAGRDKNITADPFIYLGPPQRGADIPGQTIAAWKILKVKCNSLASVTLVVSSIN